MISHHLSESLMQKSHETEGGYRIIAAKSNFPVLKGMSFYKLVLFENAAREPHWHANADELGYCLKGKVLVSFYKSGDLKQTFIVNQGETFFIPSGSLHAIENIHSQTSELLLQFSHEEPEDFALSSTFGMFTDSVLGNTWDRSSASFKALKRSLNEVFIVQNDKPFEIPKEACYSSPYHFNLHESSPLIANEAGTVRVARQDRWPILRQQSLYSLQLSGIGMREPHWHPETAEMGYMHKGKARMSILSPKNEVDTYELNPGDLYFIPKAYPHHIENLTDEMLHILIFFDQALPLDIGFSGSVKSFDSSLLTDLFACKENFFPDLPTYYKDKLIVNRVNPIN